MRSGRVSVRLTRLYNHQAFALEPTCNTSLVFSIANTEWAECDNSSKDG